MPRSDQKTLASQVHRIMLNQALGYLPDAMRVLHEVSLSADSDSARVSASRAIVNALATAADGMTEEQAGQELLRRIQDAEHHSTIETEVPQGIKNSMMD